MVRRRISEAQRWQILAMHTTGMFFKAISRLVRKHTHTNNVNDLPILLALKFVASSEKSKFMICSDSLSCLFAIESCKTQNTFILKIVEIYQSLVAIGKHIIFT
jgi:hypothetical protein